MKQNEIQENSTFTNLPSLELKDCSLGYGKKVVLKNATFSVSKGKILTLIGPNGCGKSTLLKSITNQLKTIEGVVFVSGKDMAGLREEDLSKIISMVMTGTVKPELMTCKEMVATGRYPYTGRLGILSPKDWERVDSILELFQLQNMADMQFSEISDGQRQRVMLARAVCQDTQILVLDEPTSYLDVRYKIEILKAVEQLAHKEQIAVIMSLHELDLARQISDEIACIKDGMIVKLGTPAKIYQGEFLQQLFDISPECFDVETGQIVLGNEN